MPTNDKKLRVFLCHSSQDKPIVRELYQRLLADGRSDPWLDQEKLLPGQDWEMEIRRAVREADVVVICLSTRSVTKEGYVQKEIKFAIDIAEEKTEGAIFLIPARLEDCAVPVRLKHLHWVDLFEDTGYSKLMQALSTRGKQIDVAPYETPELFSYFENLLNDHDLNLPRDAVFEDRLQDPTSIYLPLRYASPNSENKLFDYLKSGFVQPGILLLLGNYGSGKSFIVRRYLAEQIQSWRKSSGDKSVPLPVFFSLKRFTNVRGDSIIEEIQRELRASGLSKVQPETVQEMVDEGRVLFILDGFDEILLLAYSADIQQRFNSIVSPLKPERNRILITSRPGAITWDSNAADRYSLQTLNLLPWDKGMWDDYLYACKGIGWDYPVEQIKVFRDFVLEHQELSSLTSVPLYCQMMVETSRELMGRFDHINLSTLYDLYVQKYLERDAKRSIIDDVDVKCELMMAVAFGMLQKGTLQFTVSDLQKALRENAQHLNSQIIDIFATHDLTVHSMLIFDHENKLSFSHKSFYEYFNARRIHNEIRREFGNKQLTTLKSSLLSDEMLEFLIGMFTTEDKAFLQRIPALLADKSNTLGAGRSRILLRNLGLLHLGVRGELKDLELGDLDFRGISFSKNKSHIRIVNVNLDKCKLVNSNLTGAELRHSSLRGANFHNCILDQADLRDADLSGAILHGISCRGARFCGAKLENVRIGQAEFLQILTAIRDEKARDPSSFDNHWGNYAQTVLEQAGRR